MTTRITKKPYLLFLPFLLFYIVFTIVNAKGFSGDETRYLDSAVGLLHGNYSPPLPNVTLFSGPGYPLTILPFVAVHAPVIVIRLLNAFFLYFSIILLYKILIRRVSVNKTLLCCFFWGCYYNSYDYLPLMIPEVICPFVVALLLFLLDKAFEEIPAATAKRYLLLSGVVFGWLALIKVVFGYVVLCMLAGCTVLWLIKRKNSNNRKAMLVVVTAFITVLPYLMYTYHITGRVLYWSTMGGNNLYWMSRANNLESGSWFPTPYLKNDTLAWNTTGAPELKKEPYIQPRQDMLPSYPDSIIAYDKANLKAVAALKEERALEQDDAYKKAAIENIKNDPKHFISNCFSNAGRMIFNFPYSYALQKPSTLLRLPLNGLILVLMIFSIIPTFINWRKIPYAIRFMLFVSLIYFGGSLLGSAEIRMFTVIVPVVLVWVAYILHKAIKIKPLKWRSEE